MNITKHKISLSRLLFGALLLFFFVACSDDTQESVVLASFSYSYGHLADTVFLTSTSTGEITQHMWRVVDVENSTLLNRTGEQAVLILPAGVVSVTVSLTVNSPSGFDATSKTIHLPKHMRRGLGSILTAKTRNNIDREWYIDQGNTGVHSSINCGPASVVMAIKWADSTFTGTAEEARNTFRAEGGWWYTSDMSAYLDRHNIPNFTAHLPDANALKEEIRSGNIVILCLDVFFIRRHIGHAEWRTNRFFEAFLNAGHFIVVKGYKVVDGITWFEVYDPWSMGLTYADGTLKGRGRYYRGEDIMQATNVWWQFMIVVSPICTDPPILAAPPRNLKAVDPSTIPAQRSGPNRLFNPF